MSSAVVNTSVRLVGMVVLRSMSLVITPPLVSMPRLQRGDVEQQHVLDVAAQHAGLDRGADGDDLVGVDRLVRLLAGQSLHEVGDGGHAGGAADEDHVVEVALADAGVLERLLERDAAALDEVGRHLLELRAA